MYTDIDGIGVESYIFFYIGQRIAVVNKIEQSLGEHISDAECYSKDKRLFDILFMNRKQRPMPAGMNNTCKRMEKDIAKNKAARNMERIVSFGSAI
ncbi:MAG: hypothetical protein WDO16_10335 [Bacteroidota bacterium]